ncbi:MAG: helix-turn-helix domain-containing protein [Oscillospiraceae bacterium]|nr:helix-turn-helix domain-containing protein [Oscillospiraceae bacterium]
MTMKNKQELIAQVVTLLSTMIETNDAPPITITESKSQPIEMLTVKECTEAIKGLSEHTVRQLVAQDKLPYIRTGQGQRGKILISKTALLSYFGGAA